MTSRILFEKSKSVFSAKDKSILFWLISSFSEQEKQKNKEKTNICNLNFKVDK